MLRLAASRLIQLPLILGVIFVITLMFAWVMPGDPLRRPDEKKPPESVIRELESKYNLGKGPFFFGKEYVKGIFLGSEDSPAPDFGPSLSNPSKRVREMIFDGFKYSAILGIVALFFALMIGTVAGIIGALRPNSMLDGASLGMALIGISLPSFVTGAILIALFAGILKWFPLDADFRLPNVSFFAEGWGDYYKRGEFWGDIRHAAHSLILPGLTLSLAPAAYIARLIRLGLAEIMSSDFIRTARAKGLSHRKAITHHAMKLAYLPVLSFMGPAAAAVMTGSFVVEKLFNMPGLGTYFVSAVLTKDQFLILGLVLTYATMLILFNLIVDLAYAWLDPRIDLAAE